MIKVNNKTSLLFVSLSTCLGVVFASYINIYFSLALVFFAISSICLYIKSNTFFLFLSLFFLGNCLYVYPINSTNIANIKKAKFTANLKCKIVIKKEKGYIAKVLKVNNINASGKVLFYPALNKNLKPNCILQTTASFNHFLLPKNPYTFNFKKYYNNKNIHFKAVAKTTLKIIKPGKYSYLDKLKIYLNNRILKLFDKNNEFVKSILIAGKKPNNYNIFVKTQTAHLMAVSGLHLGFFALTLLVIFKPFFYKFSYIFVLLFSFMFLAICNFTPALTRAFLMLFYLILARLMQKKVSVYNALGFSMLIAILINPKSIFTKGFILSYLAVFIIFLLLSCLKKHKKWQKNVAITILIPYFMLGISLYFFNELNFIGLVSNFVLGFLFYIVYALAMLVLVSGLWQNSFKIVYNFFIVVAKKMQTLPLNFGYHSFSIFNLILFYVLAALFMYFLYKQKKINALICLLLSAVALFTYTPCNKQLKLISFSAGNSDIHLIKTPNNKIVLIDTSNPKNKYLNPSTTCFNYLKKNGFNCIDYIFITHAHADHYGGYNLINKNFKVKNTLASQKVINLINAKNFTVVTDTLTINIDEVKFSIIHPKKGVFYENENNNSLTIRLDYKNFSTLFTGDIEKEVEELLASNKKIKNCDVLKVAHHGSNTSSINTFIKNVNAKIAIIPAKNVSGFPSKKVLDRLNKIVKKTYVTQNATVIISTNGQKTANVTPYLGKQIKFNIQ